MTSRGTAWAAAGLVMLLCSGACAQDIDVVASFKPVHSLVAGVMAGVGEPTLLVKGAASPHDYALKPSDAAALEQAELVFWIGEGFETFLAKPLATLAAGERSIELGRIDGLVLLPPREGGVWDAHDHDEAEHEALDGHVWLDPRNAKAMVAAITAALAARDPAHALAYKANGEALQSKLDQLDAEIEARLASVKDVPFIVFHDAFQYLERRYGLAGVGSITVSPEQPPGAMRLQAIQEAIVAQGARCAFREPNFAPAVVDTVIAGTAARTGILDPEGAALTDGPDMYFELMRENAEALRSCLAASS